MWGDDTDEVLIGIELLHMEYKRSRVPFMARLIGLESQPGKRGTQIRSFSEKAPIEVLVIDHAEPANRKLAPPASEHSSRLGYHSLPG